MMWLFQNVADEYILYILVDKAPKCLKEGDIMPKH